MAKSKSKEVPLAERIEQAIRKAVDETPGVNDVGELDYCDAVLEAIDSYSFGVKMRREELSAEDDAT